MDITTRLQFAAPPTAGHAMPTDEKDLDAVCRETESTTWDVEVAGATTRTTRAFPAPAAVARFTGAELRVSERTVWGEAAADGTRSGELEMTVQGQPVSMRGRLALAAGGPGTVVELNGELKVASPLPGKKLEQSNAPAVPAGCARSEERRVGK